MNAEISETIRATLLGLGMQIPKIPAQRKFVSEMCLAHFNAHKPPTNLKKLRIFRKLSQIEKWDLRFRFRSPVRSACLLRKYPTPTQTPTSRPSLWRPQFSFYKILTKMYWSLQYLSIDPKNHDA